MVKMEWHNLKTRQPEPGILVAFWDGNYNLYSYGIYLPEEHAWRLQSNFMVVIADSQTFFWSYFNRVYNHEHPE